MHAIPSFCDPAELERAITQLQHLSVSRDLSPSDGRTLSDLLRSLHCQLIEPIPAHLLPELGSILTIVPHAQLFGIPFAALKDQDNRHLIEKYALAHTPAVAVLRFTRAQKLQIDRSHALLC
jgi:CHAT domain-containing protein